MARWAPAGESSTAEQRLLKVAGRSRKLFVFLRENRDDLFDDAFQGELIEAYRQSGQGQAPQPPALMCMALLLQGYMQVSDAEAVRCSASDRCWRLVLGTLLENEDEPAFSQGGLQPEASPRFSSEHSEQLLKDAHLGEQFGESIH